MEPGRKGLRNQGPPQPTTMRNVPVSYYQEVLDKISHADARIFRKELRKAFKRLLPEQREELKRWFRNACLCKVPADRLIPEPVVGRSSDKGQLK